MHDCGLLGRVFPEFQAISWRVVRDFYHRYTVDEHTLLTIRNLERLTGDVEPGRQRFANVLAGLPHPSSWCCRCCCTTWASGATTTMRSKANAWPRTP